jgi:hypothetical protein
LEQPKIEPELLRHNGKNLPRKEKRHNVKLVISAVKQEQTKKEKDQNYLISSSSDFCTAS